MFVYQRVAATWQGHLCQALIKIPTKCQGLKTTWQGHVFQALVKLPAKCQGLKTTWQGHVFQAVIKFTAQFQVFNSLWHIVQRPLGCCTFYPCHSLHCKFSRRDRHFLDSAPCGIKICWNISTRECYCRA